MYYFKLCLLVFCLFLLNLRSSLAQECAAVITPSNPAPVCQPETILLTATAGTGLSYQWQKDGSNIPNATTNTLTVAASGSYTVTVSGPTCTTKTSTPVSVIVNPQPVLPTFIANPNTTQCAGTPTNFSIVSPAADVSYVWDFGDGTTTSGSTVNHSFYSVGNSSANFTVQVFALSQAGCLSSVRSSVVTVNQKPPFAPPTDSSSFQVCVPDSVKKISQRAALLNNSANAGNITSYVIDFGDGAGPKTYTPAQFNATTPIRNSIPYDTTGAFPITVRAIGANGCDSVFTKDFQVNRKPKAHFTPDKARIIPEECVPVKVTVDTDSSTGGNLEFEWQVVNSQGQNAGVTDVEYIESTTDTSASPVFSFKTKGRFNIKLVVSNSCGTDSTEQSVLIALPEVQMFADSTFCGTPASLKFDASKVTFDPNLGTISSYEWRVTGASGATAINGTSLQDKAPEISFPNVGEYTVTVVVKNECGASDEVEQQAATATITVNPVPAAPTFSTTTAQVCEGVTAIISPSGPGTTFNFYSEPTGGTPITSGRTYTTDTLTTSTTIYVASVSDQNCESTSRTPFVVNVVPGITDNTITLSENGGQVCEGSPAATITGSAAKEGNNATPYLWQRSTTSGDAGFTTIAGATTQNLEPGTLTANTWFRRLAQSNFSCNPDTSNVVVITVLPPLPENKITIIDKALETVCEGSPMPEITGTPILGVQYIWESREINATVFTTAAGVANQQNYTPGNLTQTTFFRRRAVSPSCESTSEVVEIRVVPRLADNVIQSDQIICTDNAAPVPLTGTVPTGGTGTYIYRWESSLTGVATDFQPAAGTPTTQNYTPGTLTTTTYFRRVVESGACEPNISNVVRVTISNPITNNTITAKQTTICQGTTTEITGSSPGGGAGTFSFIWERSTTSAIEGFVPITGATGVSFTPTSATLPTWYRRLVSSSGSTCPPLPSNVVEIRVEAAPPAPTVEAANVASCGGAPVTLRATGTGTTFEWFTVSTGGTPVFIGPVFTTEGQNGPTSYFVQAKNGNQCASLTRTEVKVNISNVEANAGPDVTIISGESASLRASGGTTYAWSPAEGLSSTTIANPSASATKTTTYTVVVTDEFGCSDTDEVIVTVIPAVKIVNTFSPNGDGINEVWEIENLQNFPDITVEIFNRWGQQVFFSKGYGTPWNGTFQGKALPVDTYYYLIRLNQEENPLKGSVTIIK